MSSTRLATSKMTFERMVEGNCVWIRLSNEEMTHVIVFSDTLWSVGRSRRGEVDEVVVCHKSHSKLGRRQ